jgi:hypothetical protein
MMTISELSPGADQYLENIIALKMSGHYVFIFRSGYVMYVPIKGIAHIVKQFLRDFDILSFQPVWAARAVQKL